MDRSFTTTIEVDRTPAQVFAAINDVRAWWSQDITGPTDRLGATFRYRYGDVHRCTIKVTEVVPGQRVVWHVLENYFSFTRDSGEWTGTDIVFDISTTPGGSELRFTHVGLVPEEECYEACREGWTTYIGSSLRDLILTGEGRPNRGEPITQNEKALTA